MSMRPVSTPRRAFLTLVGCGVFATAGLLAHAAPPAVVSAAVVHRHASIPNGGTVIASEADTPQTLNPYLSQQLSVVDIDSAVFDSLVLIDNKGRFTPDLATKWKSNKAGTRWVFYLNPKATWQDGKPVTAADVVFTQHLVINKNFPATSTLGFDHVKTIKAVGKYQVDVTLTTPYAPFLAYWGTSFILPKHVLGGIAPDKVRTDAAYSTKPLGSGPFKITQNVSGDHYTLVANKNYFRGAPHLASIIFRIVPNSNTVVNQLQTGEVNLAGQTSDISARQFNDLKHVSGLKTYNTPGFNWQHVDLLETGFLKDVKVRQAMMMATDRAKIIKDIALGYGTPQYSDQPPSKKLFYDPSVTHYWTFDPAKASQMLAADGFTRGSNGILEKGGVPFNLTLYGDSGGGTTIAQLLELLKNEWSQVGINATIKLLDAATLFGNRGPLYDPNRLSSNTMQAVQYEWIEGYDPDDSFFWNSNQIISPSVSSGGNFDGYHNAQVDQLTTQGLTTVNTKAREKIYKKLSVILAKEVPDIWLYWGRVLSAATSKLHNYKPNPFNYNLAWNAKDWYLQ
jgi:peptide/nickel transport system substrate-binding protein